MFRRIVEKRLPSKAHRDSQDVKRLTTTYPYVSQPNLHENSLAPGEVCFSRAPPFVKRRIPHAYLSPSSFVREAKSASKKWEFHTFSMRYPLLLGSL